MRTHRSYPAPSYRGTCRIAFTMLLDPLNRSSSPSFSPSSRPHPPLNRFALSLRALTSSSSLSRLPSLIFSTRESLYLHTLPPLRFVQPQLYKRHPKPHRSLCRRILSLTTRPLSERAFRILHPPFCHPQISIAPILHRPLLVPIHSARLPRPRNHSVPLLRSMGL